MQIFTKIKLSISELIVTDSQDITSAGYGHKASTQTVNNSDLKPYHISKIIEPLHEKTNNVISDQVQQKPVCAVTEEG